MRQAGSEAKFRRPSKLDPHTEEIVDLYCVRRWPLVKIAERFGVTHNTIAYHLRRCGHQTRGKGGGRLKASFGEIHVPESVPITEKDFRCPSRLDPHADEIIRLYDSAVPTGQIAARFGVTRKAIPYFLKKIGHPIRSFSETRILQSKIKRKVKVGDKSGKLTVIGPDDGPAVMRNKHGGRRLYYLCRCECGKEAFFEAYSIRTENAKSCGCTRGVRGQDNHFYKHGFVKTRLFNIWTSMRQRCSNPRVPAYPNYGGRGIRICEEWSEFSAFKSWAESTGYNDNLTLDRVDPDGHYEPSNCRWSTPLEQAANTRRNFYVEAFGDRKCASEWARDPRCNAGSGTTIIGRIRAGWSPEDAISRPVRQTKRSRLHSYGHAELPS